MYPGRITDKIVDIICGFFESIVFCVVVTFTFMFFYAITLGIMSIVYLLN